MLAYLFVILAVVARLIPHPWHLTPVGAALLFFGAKRPIREWIVALGAFAATDVYLTRFHYGYPIGVDHLVTWAWYVAAMGIGYLLVRRVNPMRVMGSALASSISFFIVSNFAVWALHDMYPKTLAGLAQCYTLAIPFFRGTLASDLLFTPILFSIPFAIAMLNRQTETARLS